MAKNFYAVKVGLVPGIYKTWAECQNNTVGISGAKFQGFMTYDEALKYMGDTDFTEGKFLKKSETKAPVDESFAFVDGSYDSASHIYGFGGYIMHNGVKHILQGNGMDAEMATMHNVAGEVLGCMTAVKKAIELGIKELTIYYDYAGIENWALGSWKRNKKGTIAYYEYMQDAQKNIKLKFVHVKGHSGVDGNEEADTLAKEAVQKGIAEMNDKKSSDEKNFSQDLHKMRNEDSDLIRPCDIIADMHTHTIFSGHAFSTLKENLEAASNAGMKFIAVTDHYYKNGTELDQKNEFNRIRYVQQRVNPNKFGIQVVGSVECNLEQTIRPDLECRLKDGTIKYRPIGFHSWFVPREERTVEEIITDFKRAHEETNFNVFVHIERELDKICHGAYGKAMTPDLEHFFNELIDYAKKNNILLEVNESSLAQDNCGNRERMKYWVEMAKKNGNEIVLGTDAHYCDEVGRFDNVIAFLNEIGYPKSLIINCNEERIKAFI